MTRPTLTHVYESNRSGELTEIILDALVISAMAAMIVLAPNAIQIFRNYGKKEKPKRIDPFVSVFRIDYLPKSDDLSRTFPQDIDPAERCGIYS